MRLVSSIPTALGPQEPQALLPPKPSLVAGGLRPEAKGFSSLLWMAELPCPHDQPRESRARPPGDPGGSGARRARGAAGSRTLCADAAGAAGARSAEE